MILNGNDDDDDKDKNTIFSGSLGGIWKFNIIDERDKTNFLFGAIGYLAWVLNYGLNVIVYCTVFQFQWVKEVWQGWLD